MDRLDINNENLAMAQDVDYEYLLDNKYGIRNLSKKNETKIALLLKVKVMVVVLLKTWNIAKNCAVRKSNILCILKLNRLAL